MALLLPSSSSLIRSLSFSFSSAPSLSPPCLTAVASLPSRIQSNQLNLQQECFKSVPLNFSKKRPVVVQAAAETDGTVGTDSPASSEKQKEAVPVENLPLESKMQMKLEQKLKMKMAKKLRLRRKRLVKKRHMRKKGRWPPSKMKKLKNV